MFVAVLAGPTVHAAVILDAVPVAGSPTVTTQVGIPDMGVLSIGAGGSITFGAGDAVINTGGGSTITITTAVGGSITSTSNDAIDISTTILLLNNSGTISGDVDGVRADTITELLNRGTISAENNTAIFTTNALTDITNYGIISSNLNRAVEVGSIGSLINYGTVTTFPNGDNAFHIQGNLTTAINYGTISGAGDGVYAAGISTSFTNYGTISSDFDDGVDVGGTLTTLNNYGTIAADNGDTGVVAAEITTLNNYGSITGFARGVRAGVGDITSLNNYGTISGNSDEGVLASGDITSLVNYGTISSTTWTGIRADGIVSLTNAGTIIGGNGTAILETGAVDTLLTLKPGSKIQGTIDLGGGTNTVVIEKGVNASLDFAALPDVLTANGAPVATSGTTVAVVDPGLLAADHLVVSDVAASVASVVTGRLDEVARPAFRSPTTKHRLASAGPNPLPGFDLDDDFASRFWVKGLASYQKTDFSDGTTNVTHYGGGVILGADNESWSGSTLGFFVGSSLGHLDNELNSQDMDIDSYFVGAYNRHDGANAWVDFAVTGGVSRYHSERIAGPNIAKSDYNGFFIAPEVTVGTRRDMDLFGIALKPSLRGRYIGTWLESYAETGSGALLSVNDREVHILEARLQLAAVLSEDADHVFELRAGLDSRFYLDNASVNATLLAQPLSFDPGGQEDGFTGYVGGNYMHRIDDTLYISVNAEAGVGTETEYRLNADVSLVWTY